MIRHIVMWKLDNSYSTTEKQSYIDSFAEKLLNLEGKIPELKGISVHLNSKEAAAANYDLMLDTSFESIEGLNAYQVHPDHVEVVEYSKTFKKERACVDFEG